MAELKDLVQFALDKQPSKFKDAFAELVSQRVVDKVDELKSEISANMFGEAPEDDDEDLDADDLLDDEDLELSDEDEELLADLDLDDDELPQDEDEDLIEFDDEDDLDFGEEGDDEDDDSFNEEGPAIEEGRIGDFIQSVKNRMANDIGNAEDNRAAKARDEDIKAKLKKHYGTSNMNRIHKIRAHRAKHYGLV